MNIVWWLIVGLLAGFIARALVPGRDPMGFFGTLLLGLAGSMIGGAIGNLFARGDNDFSPSGLIGSIVGAILALLVWRAIARNGKGHGSYRGAA